MEPMILLAKKLLRTITLYLSIIGLNNGILVTFVEPGNISFEVLDEKKTSDSDAYRNIEGEVL